MMFRSAWILFILCSVLYFSCGYADCPPQKAWIDSRIGSLAGNGSLEAPFLEFTQIAALLAMNDPEQDCKTEINFSPGFYPFANISAIRGFTFQRCTTCPEGAERQGEVSIIVQRYDLLFVRRNDLDPTHNTVRFFNISFIGQDYYEGLKDRSRDSSSSTTHQGVEDPTPTAPIPSTSPQPSPIPIWASLALIEVEAELVFDNVKFLGIARSTDLIHIIGSPAYISRTLFFGNKIQLPLAAPDAVAQESHVVQCSYGQVVIQDSSFISNTWSSYLGLYRIVYAGLVHLKMSKSSIHNVTFLNNSAEILSSPTSNFESDSRFRTIAESAIAPFAYAKLSGAAISTSRASALNVSNCNFKDNKLVVPFNLRRNITTFGGAIGVAEIVELNVLNSTFTGNQAHYGAGIGLIDTPLVSSDPPSSKRARPERTTALETDEAASTGSTAFTTSSRDLIFPPISTYIVVDSSSMLENVCQFGGCAIYISPLSATTITILRSIFQDNQLNLTDYCSQGWPSFAVSASAISMAMQSSAGEAPSASSFNLINSTIGMNLITVPSECSIGRSSLIMLHQVIDSTIQNIHFDKINWWSSGSFSLVLIRRFWHAVLDGVVVSDCRIQDQNKAFDIQDDLAVFTMVNPAPSVSVRNCVFDSNRAGTILYIVNVNSVVIKNTIHIDKAPENYFRQPTVISLNTIFSSIWIANWTSSTTAHPIYIANTPSLTLSDIHIDAYTSIPGVSSLTLVSIANATIEDSTWSNCSPSAISASSSDLTIINSRFVQNDGGTLLPGAISLASGQLRIFDSHFLRNRGFNGGAIQANGLVQATRTIFELNTAFVSGGALMIVSGLVSLDQVRCLNNSADSLGGCLYVWSSARSARSVTNTNASNDFVNSWFDGNSAQFGGAFAVSDVLTTNWTGCHLRDNRSRNNGGALYALLGQHQLHNCTFSRNRASKTNRRPSSSLVQRAALPRPSRTSISATSAQEARGGAIFLEHAHLTVNNCTFTYCFADTHGGAIFINEAHNNDAIEVSQSKFHLNEAVTSGGALAIASTGKQGICGLSVNASLFLDNWSDYGGAISLAPEELCVSQYEVMQDPETVDLPIPRLIGTMFDSNKAQLSGGAIYYTGLASGFPHYWHVNYTSNMAFYGGTFFFNPLPVNGVIENAAPDFCDVKRCRINLGELTDRRRGAKNTGAFWGPFWASAGLRPAPQTLAERTSLKAPVHHDGNYSAYPGDWNLDLSFSDLYDQMCLEALDLIPNVTLRDEPIGLQCTSGLSCPWTVLASAGRSSIGLNFFLAPNFLQVSRTGVFNPNDPNPYDKPISISGAVIFSGVPVGDPSAYITTSVEIKVKLQGCPVGKGLAPTVQDAQKLACLPCSLNTYNLDGNGQCYACGADAICERYSVDSAPGFWVSNINDTNALYVAECPLGFCAGSPCTTGREGVLCADCLEGQFESLFPFCSAVLCRTPRWGFLVVLGALITVAFPLTLHVCIFRWPEETRHVFNLALLAFLILQPLFEWALPLASHKLASFLCGFRASPLQRGAFLAFVPYAALLGLWIFFAFERLVSFLPVFPSRWRLRLQQLHATGSLFSFTRFALSSITIIYLVGLQPFKFALDFEQCSTTPFGHLWLLHPSVMCDSQAFKNSKIVIWIIVAVLTIGTHLAIGAFFIYRYVKQRSDSSSSSEHQLLLIDPNSSNSGRYDSIAMLPDDLPKELIFAYGSRLQQISFFISSGRSFFWPFIEMTTRMAIPLICSLTIFHPNLRSALLASVFFISMGFNSITSPFDSLSLRVIASGSWAALATTSIWLIELQSTPKLALAAFWTLPVCLLILVLLFAGFNWKRKRVVAITGEKTSARKVESVMESTVAQDAQAGGFSSSPSAVKADFAKAQ